MCEAEVVSFVLCYEQGLGQSGFIYTLLLVSY